MFKMLRKGGSEVMMGPLSTKREGWQGRSEGMVCPFLLERKGEGFKVYFGTPITGRGEFLTFLRKGLFE